MDEYQKLLEKLSNDNRDNKDDSKVVMTRILSKVERLSNDVDSIEKSAKSIRGWVRFWSWLILIPYILLILIAIMYLIA